MEDVRRQTADDEQTADEHDAAGEPDCSCAACERVRGRRWAARGAGVAPGGIAPWAHELLGRGWVDDERGRMGGSIGMPELAAKALGDTFNALARIGDAGRDRAYPLYALAGNGSPAASSPPMTRTEALELIRAAEQALDYARVHVDWLPRGQAGTRIQLGDRVTISGDDAEGAVYTVERLRVEGMHADVVELASDDGERLCVNQRDLRTADLRGEAST